MIKSFRDRRTQQLFAAGWAPGVPPDVTVNRQWRICFRFEDGHAYDVEFCDYH
jgi:plasmid maintenance system killer protein